MPLFDDLQWPVYRMVWIGGNEAMELLYIVQMRSIAPHASHYKRLALF